MHRRNFAIIAAAAAVSAPLTALAAGPKDLNGRWDLTVPGNDRKRAWWLEIKGADTASPSGSFVGASGGDCDPIRDIKVNPDGSATFAVRREIRNPKDGVKEWVGTYKVRAAGSSKIEGTAAYPKQAPQTFSGVRAPKFEQADGSKMKAGAPVELFNGRDVSGWHALRTNTPFLWKVEQGVLKNGPGTTDIVSDAKFMDFKLHVEYRVGPGSNSGIGLRGRYEVQILEDLGKPANTHGNGALYSRILPTENASKPANEWQTVDITLAGNIVTVVLNGKKVIDAKEIDGLTAIAMDPDEGEPGPLVLQGDHGPVEFRKITVTPLSRK
ncbi:MAG: DUF1080 domain-containing protein [Bryobacteraceae bacterium]|nr:DUF1080 domain-containing protein [Bryobacteraceae bacterium]